MADRFGRGFDADLFGLAADALVNETLLLAEHGLPRPAVTVTGLLKETGLPEGTAIAALTAWDAERLYMKLSEDAEEGGPRQGLWRPAGLAARSGSIGARRQVG